MPFATSDSDASLPDRHAPHLGLVQPTHDELVEHSRLNGREWKAALSLEAYVRREIFMAEQHLTKDSGLTYWALVDTSLSEKDRVILAGCESLRKRALVWSHGKVHEIIAHGVASVFTPPGHRGRGFGDRMMAELGIKLRHWQESPERPVLASVLYSDIGKHFYAKHGWHPAPSSHVHLPVAIPKEESDAEKKADDKVKLLRAEDLEALCLADEKLIRGKLEGLSAQQTAVALVPDIHTIQWHHAREEFVSTELFGKAPTTHGAMTKIGKSRAWMIWARMWQSPNNTKTGENKMHVLRMVLEDESLEEDCEEGTGAQIEGIASLMRAAQREAADWKMDVVELWNPHPRTVAAAKMIDSSACEIHRDTHSITSLKWYGEPADDGVIWLENEKYGWC